MEQQSTGSAWPEPPKFYRRYTKANLERLKHAQAINDYSEEPIKQPHMVDFSLRSLEPPEVPTDDYVVFDQHWKVQDRLPTLQEQNIKQLFPKDKIDRVAELKRLNRTLLVQFLDLLETLAKNPDEYGKQIENISIIFINMHHILNEYRPHQAREALRILMEEQLEKKRNQTAQIKRKTQETMDMLKQFGHSISSSPSAESTKHQKMDEE
ncbi:mediator complex, subunit Med7 [Halteromyces radiatus]|uniref:mediator complex, subunit Med7 n=1 Tax=Halteromyces radiatus TaxID=101107 RepID=UPI0022200383|nr:mediator complex, subunit Med7 [Halteromyces radiatus]KAI8099618.1 mediator complex, subunit Med7 [Halteromyces radiatus]